MTYIGNPPLGSFATVTSQSFNGDGSTTVFTLNKHVNSATELECFVSNVQQEPGTGKAFTASGTTLTFSEAPPSGTGNIYVIYRGLAQHVGQDENAPRLVGNNAFTGNQTITGDLTTTGTISATTSNTTNGTFLNTGGHNTSSGVVHVKQSGATNNPTMVLEQTGEGGNTGDKQGLHIKLAGQNSGDGQAIAVTTTNSNLNSGTAFDCFRVFNNGAMSLLNQANTLMDVTSDGYVKRPQLPAVFATRNSTEQIFSGTATVVTNFDSSYYNSYPVNNKSWWDASTSKYTAPTGSGTTYHYVSFSSLFGVTIPSSGTNYGLIGIYHSGTALANKIYRAYMDVPSSIGTAGNMKFNTLTACGVVKMVAGNYLQPFADGTNGVNKRVHSGTYTNFSAIQIG